MNRVPRYVEARRGALKQGALTFLLVFGVYASWSLATPMFASPDEPAHMIRAEAIVRGDAAGRGVDSGGRAYNVSPMFRANVGCFAFKPNATAACLAVPSDGADTLVVSSAASYPPGFHLAVGWPSLVADGLGSLYLMRLANAFACAMLTSLAISTLRGVHPRRFLVLGLSLAMTPMLFFVGGSVNPSGIAASAGLAAWAGAVALSRTTARRTTSADIHRFAGPLCVLLLVRRDSLIWAGAIVVSVLILFSTSRLRLLLTRPATWAWVATATAIAFAQLFLWTGTYAESFAEGSSKNSNSALAAFGEIGGPRTAFIPSILSQVVGTFGWLDTKTPGLVFPLWFGAAAAMVLAALAWAPRRVTICLLVTTGLMIGIITAIGAIRFPYMQGRYVLPLIVGVPIVAGYGLDKLGAQSRISWRARTVLVGFFVILHSLSFGQHLRRYVVGADGGLDFLWNGTWTPPVVPASILLVVYVAFVAGLYTHLSSDLVSRNESETSPVLT